MPRYDKHDKSQQANQKKERERLKNAGVNPKTASTLAKLRFPLPNSQSAKKNRQP